MRIGFACDWKRDRIRTWSHTSHSLLTALQEMPGVECFDLDVSLPPYQVYTYALLNARIVDGKLKSKFRFLPAYTKRLERNFQSLLNKFSSLDAIIEISDPAVTKSPPCYLYQDVSVDMLIQYYQEHGRPRLQFEMFSMDDLKRRRERQMRLYEDCAGVFCMSRSLAESLINVTGLPTSKIHLVHAGVHVKPVKVSTPPFNKNGHPLILFVGRDFFRKAGDLVVEAFKVLRKEHLPGAKLVVTGPKKWPLQGSIPDGIIFLGDASWNLLQQYYSFADLFCMPSRDEGFGIVYAEALCYGIPCIGRKTDVVSEIIQNAVNGYLLERDDVYGLADLIVKALKDEEMQGRVKSLAPKYQEYYSWERVADDMVKVIEKEIKGANERHESAKKAVSN